VRFISLFASFGHNFKYSSSSHIFLPILSICNSHKLHPYSLHVFLPFHRNYFDTRSVTHEISALEGPIARRFLRGELILFLHVDFSFSFFSASTCRFPNERLLLVRDTYGHHLPGVYYFRRRCRERRDSSIRLHSFLLSRWHHRHLRARFRFFPRARRFLPVPRNEKISRVSPDNDRMHRARRVLALFLYFYDRKLYY